jgi:hypothetical protein
MAKSKAHSQPNAQLEKNLGYSMQAVNYVLHRAKIKAANYDYYDPLLKPVSFEFYGELARGALERQDYQAFEGFRSVAEAHMNAVDKCVYVDSRQRAQFLIDVMKLVTEVNELRQYRIIADFARRYGCGNCKEASITAFMFLYDMGVRPIDRVRANPDHDFVVIGRQQHEDFADWNTWGEHAVICDPWSQGLQKGRTSAGTYSASQFGNVMGAILPNIDIFETYREE